MTHVCCPDCRLRFVVTTGTYLDACPKCGGAPQPMAGLEAAVGFRLFRLEDSPHVLPEAAAVSVPFHDPSGGRA